MLRSNNERRWWAGFHAVRLAFEDEVGPFDLDDLSAKVNDPGFHYCTADDGQVVRDPHLGKYAVDVMTEVARGLVFIEFRPRPPRIVDGIPSEEELKLRVFGGACEAGLLTDYAPCEFFLFVGNPPHPGGDLMDGHGGYRYSAGGGSPGYRWCWCEHCRQMDIGSGGVPHLCPQDSESVDPPAGGAFRLPTYDHPMVKQMLRAALRWDARRSWEDVG